MSYRNNQRGGYSQNGGYNNGGGRGQRGDNVSYMPNSGKAAINQRRRSDRDPGWTGPMNIEITAEMLQNLRPGDRLTLFVSVWENTDGSLGLKFKQPNEQNGNQGQQGRQGGYQQPRQNGGYQQRQNGYSQPQQGYNAYPEHGQHEPRQNGAMSRARPIPPQPHYDDGPPPHDIYPEGPEIEPGGYELDQGGISY